MIQKRLQNRNSIKTMVQTTVQAISHLALPFRSLGHYLCATVLLFTLSIGNAWASSDYYAQVNVSVAAASPTGAGTVYVSTASNYPEGNNTKSTSTATAAGVSQTQNVSDAPTFTFYVKAVPNQGYYMKQWAFSGGWKAAPASTTTATSQSGTVTGSTNTATATAAATFDYVKVTAAPADVNINAESPSATYPDAAGKVVGFTLNGSNAANDYTTGGEGDSRWVISAWPTRASSTNITFNYKFVGNGSYGTDNRTIVKTVTLKGYIDETVKTCTLTAKYPNPKVIGGVNQEIFTTYKAAADQETVTKTATFDVVYGDNANNFTAAFSGTNGGGTWTITGISVDQTNQKATVTYTFNGNKVPGIHQATLTLTAKDCHGWNNTGAAGSGSAAITITATNEQESDYDARVIAADGVTELYKGAWATAWTTANTAANAGCTLQVLRNVTGGDLNANQKVTNTFTLDLNGKVLSAKYNGSIIYLNTAGKTLTIKDSKTGGRIENVNNAYAGAAYVVNAEKGNLILESGTLYCENKGASGRRAVGVYNQAGTTVTMNGGKIEVHGYNNSQGVLQTSNKNDNTSFTMNRGEIEVDGYQDIYGISAPGKVNINDGTINVTATYTNCRGITLSAAASATAADCYWGTLTMKGGTINSTCTANADGTRSAYGVFFDCSNAGMGTAVATDGSHANKAASTGTIENATINVSTLGRYAYGVIAYGSYQSKTNHYDVIQIKNTKIDVTSQYYYTYGVYATGGVNETHGAIYFANIELTDCEVTATTTKYHTAYAVWAVASANTVYKNAQPNYYGEYAGGATVTVNSGTYTANTGTTTAYAIGTSARAKTTYDSETNVYAERKLGGNAEGYATLNIHGGTFRANAGTTTSRAVSNGGNCTIDGGEFYAMSGSTTAYGIYTVSGKLKASGATISANATQYAYGAYADCGVPGSNQAQPGFAYAAEMELNNCDITATTRTSTEARGVVVNATNKMHNWKQFQADSTSYKWATTTYNAYKSVFPCTVQGRDSVGIAIAAKATINGCDINVTSATTTAYGVYSTATSVPASADSVASPVVNIKNTKFTVKTNGTTTAYGMYAGGPTTIDGCDFTVLPKTTTAYGVYIYDKKTTITNTKFDVKGTTTAYGFYANAAIGSTTGWDYHGDFELGEGNNVTVAATAGNTSHVLTLIAAKRNVASGRFAGDYANAATAHITDGSYKATATGTTSYVLNLSAQQVQGSAVSQPSCTIDGGKFWALASGGTTGICTTNGQMGSIQFKGGVYNVNTNLSTYIPDGYEELLLASNRPEYGEGYRYEITTAGIHGIDVCQIGSTKYKTLEEALQVVTSGQTILMIANYTMATPGDYVLPSGATLLVPYKGQTAAKTTSLERVYAYTKPTANLKLSFAADVRLDVLGTIEVGSKQAGSGQTGGYNGAPHESYGWIYLAEGSSVTLENGSKLFAWGYVTGKGEIDAKRGSTVYEMFQLTDWRGGTAISGMEGNSQKVMPVNQYYIQNVECPIKFRPGAVELCEGSCNMSSSVYPIKGKNTSTSIQFVGISGSGSLFMMDDEDVSNDTWVRKSYDAVNDKQVYEINSSAKIGGIDITCANLPLIGSKTLSSTKYVMPITNNLKIHLLSGSMYITQNLELAAGAEIEVDKEATAYVNSGVSLYVFDTDEWDAFSGTTKTYPVRYTPSWTSCPRSVSNVPDAAINVHGKFVVNGYLYTTSSGANIFSTNEDAGTVTYNSAVATGSTTVYVCNNTSQTYNAKTCYPAWLKNGEGITPAYSETAGTAAGKTWSYYDDKWQCWTQNGCFTYDALNNPYIKPAAYVRVTSNQPDANKLHHDAATGLRNFVWDENCYWWEVVTEPTAEGYYRSINIDHNGKYNYYYYDSSAGCWKIKKITVTWNIEGATTDYSVGYGTKPKWLGAVPSKTSSSSNYVWRWDGWTIGSDPTVLDNDDLPIVTANTTFTAHFYEKYYQVSVIFKDRNGATIESKLINKGSTPECTTEVPDIVETDKIYTFNGSWSPATGAITTATTYTAQYSSSPRPYEVKFLNYDNGELEVKNVNYDSHPTYNGAEPTRTGTPAFSYEFKGWKLQSTGAEYAKEATLPAVAGTQTYIAQYNQVEVRYPVTFVIDPDNHSLDVVKEYKSGQIPSYTGTPTKASTAEYDYTFIGWDPAIVAVVDAGATYTATYTQTKRKYLIQFVDADDFDNTPITSSLVEYGATPEEPAMSDKQTAGYNFTFTGWTPTIASVTGAQTYKAVYTVTPRTDIAYTVKHWQQNINDNDYTEVVADRQMPKGTVGQPTIAKAKTYTGFTAQPFEQATVEAGGVTVVNIYYNRQTFTITWVDGDDHIVETDLQVRYGAMPHYDGETPTKTATDQYDYTFTNWAPTFATVTADATYTAQFSNNTRSYQVTWVDGNGETLTTTNVLYGAAPEYDGATPTKEATAQYTYTFNNHWSPEITDETVITGPMTYTAQFDSEVNSYTITWKDGDGETLKTEELDYGLTPAYSGEIPTKTATAQYTYTFNNTWYPAVTSVADDQTYTAQFDATVNKYLIYFVDGDGNTLDNPAAADNQWEYGTTPSYTGATPTKTATDQYNYTFSGWDAIIAAVTDDATYTAEFNSTVREYAITFANVDGYGHNETINVAYGETPVCPVTPVKIDGSQVYEFDDWDNAIVPVTGEATYTAYFKSTASTRTQTITWLNEDGTQFDQTIVVYGTVPNHVGPTKTATAEWTYTFTGWTPTPVAATKDATYTASYTQSKNSYTITWLNDDNSLIDETVVEYGVTPTHADPTKATTPEYTYTFTGWTPAVASVTGNATYKATYSSTKNSYTIHWLNDDNSEIDYTTVEYGVVPSHANPTKAADVQYTYTFTGWTPNVVAVTGETNYQAQFTPTLRQYTVTWVIDGVSTSEQLDYGATPAHADPTKPATAQYTYTFTGWDKVIVPVAGDVTYTAQFSSTVNKYIITWDINGVTTTEQLEYGATPSHADATKEPTTEKIFTFSGWSPAITTVTQDRTYTAQFNESPRPYTITWVINGVSTTDQVAYGSTPTHEDPEKVVDNCSYPFDSWSPAIAPVSGDATYTAVFSDDCTMNNFFVVFQNYDGTPLYATEVAGGVTPVYGGEEPKKAGEDFSGWSPALGPVSDHTVYTAQFATPAFEAERIRNGVRVSTGTWAEMLTQANQPANAGSTIKLHKNVTAANNSTISQNMTIDLNGCTITGSTTNENANNARLLYVNNKALIVEDSKGGGKISFSGSGNRQDYCAIYVNGNSGSLTVNSGIIEGNKTAGNSTGYWGIAVSVYNNARLYINGGELLANSVQVAYAVCNSTQTTTYVTITGGKLKATGNYDESMFNSTTRVTATGGYYSTNPGNITIPNTHTKVQITSATGTPPQGDPEYDNGYTYKVVRATNQDCTVTWKQDDGTQIGGTMSVTKGQTPSHADPSKTGGDLHQYEFAGWTPALGAIYNDATYWATYHLKVKVTWMDGNDVPIYTSWVKYGETPLYMGGVVPTKESSATTNYTFNGTWSPVIGPVTKPTTFRAQFDESDRTYTITFDNLDGNNTKQHVGQFAYGTSPVCPVTPLKTEGGKAYEFLGWSPAITSVTGDATYTATFSDVASITVYTITWQNDDGTQIDQTKVAEGDIPTHASPTKDATAEYSYTFAGWTPTPVAATADATYKATFSSTKNKYTITFENYDGTVIKSDLLEYGTAITAPTNPTRPAYNFTGWSPTPAATVTGDATYTAQYAETSIVAGVTPAGGDESFYNTWNEALTAANASDGCTLRLYKNVDVTTYQTLSKSMTIDLNGRKISRVGNGNTLFTLTDIALTIDDSQGGGKIYLNGSSTSNPIRAISVGGTGSVTINGGTIETYATYNNRNAIGAAIYSSSQNATITINDGELICSVYNANASAYAIYCYYSGYGNINIEGGKLKAKSYIFYNQTAARTTLRGGYYSLNPGNSGQNVTIPEGYEKIEIINATIDPEFDNGYHWKICPKKYIITFRDGDNNTLTNPAAPYPNNQWDYGTNPYYEGTPTKTPTAQYEYEFNGTWSPEITMVTGNRTYTAQFDSKTRKHNITFANLDGNGAQQVVSVEYGQRPVCPVTPEKYDEYYSYPFIGWSDGTNTYSSDNIPTVTGPETYTAQFSSTGDGRKHEITFDPDNGEAPTVMIVPYGNMPTPPADPTKTDAQFNYTFTGWTPQIVTVTGQATYTATYSTTLRSYTITFKDYNDAVLQSTTEPYGVVPTPPADPTRNNYIFSGWSPEIVSVVGDQTYTAQYIAADVVATVTTAGGVTTPYTVWSQALNAANSNAGSTLRLYKNVIATNNSPIKQSFTLDLNGCTISCSTDITTDDQTNLFFINGAYTLTIEDSGNGGTISYTGTRRATYYAIDVYNTSAKLIVNGGIIKVDATYNNYNRYGNSAAIRLYDTNSTLNMNGGEIIATGNSYAVYHDYSTQYGKTNITGGKLKASSQIISNRSTTGDILSGGYYSLDPGNSGQNITIPTGYLKKTVTSAEPEYVEGYRYKIVRAQCDITWKNEDGSETLETDRNVSAGATTSFDGTTPTKDATAQYTYTFDGWATEANGEKVYNDGETPVAGDNVTYYAHFTATLRTYTITWKNDNGAVLETDDNVPYGTTPTYDSATPTKDATAQYTYSFDSWTPAISNVSGDATYTAQFTSTVNTYNITWKSEDGTTTLETDNNIPYGTATSFNGTMPTKDATDQYTYTFDGWATEANGEKVYEIGATPTVGGDATYYAHFSSTVNLYTITWKSEDGTTTLETDANIPYDTNTSFDGTAPTKDATARYTYTFDGWATEANGEKVYEIGATPTVGGDATYYAYYASTLRKYTVTINIDPADYGTLSSNSVTNVPYGTNVTTSGNTLSLGTVVTATPATQTAQYTYAFTSWSGVPATITGDVTITANFSRTTRTYTITWVDGDGNTLKTDEVEYGATPSYTGATPTKTETSNYTYTFNGTWSPEITAVNGDKTYTAQFDAVAKEFGELMDIIDWQTDASGNVTTAVLNMNGYTSASAKANWTIVVNGNNYTKTDRDNATQNPAQDRTMKVNIGSLTAGQTFEIQALGTADVVESKQKYTVPYIKAAAVTTLSQSEVEDNAIVYIRSGKTTLSTNINVAKVIVNPDAELVIPSGKTLTCQQLILRTEAFASAILTDNGTINVTEQTYYTRRVSNNTQHYQLGLPFDVTVANIRMSNGKAATLGSTYGLMTYDAAARAAHGKNESNWVNELSLTTLKRNTGYQLLSGSKYYNEFYFPVAYTQTTDGQGSIEVHAHHTATTSDMDRDWNYVVSPYTHVYSITEGDPADYPKIAVLNEDNTNFRQDVMTDLMPAMPFYYQAAEDGTLLLGSSVNLQRNMPAKKAAYNAYEAPQTQWIRLTLSAAEAADITNIYLASDRFNNSYEIGYDVVKLSTSGSKPFIWTTLSYGDLAFAALPDTIAEQQQIPLSIFAPEESTYTISVEHNEYLDRIEHLYIYDAATGTVVDLLNNDYLFDSSIGEQRGRLFLQPVLMKGPKVATDTDDTPDNGKIEKPVKLFIDGYIYILMPDGRMYDAVGKRVK